MNRPRIARGRFFYLRAIFAHEQRKGASGMTATSSAERDDWRCGRPRAGMHLLVGHVKVEILSDGSPRHGRGKLHRHLDHPSPVSGVRRTPPESRHPEAIRRGPVTGKGRGAAMSHLPIGAGPFTSFRVNRRRCDPQSRTGRLGRQPLHKLDNGGGERMNEKQIPLSVRDDPPEGRVRS
jgi:hypothetical protein